MRLHRTKNKGDLGVLYAQLDLAKRGFDLFLPLSEHQAFDLVAYKDNRFYRVQVKYRALVNGAVTLPFSSCWADRNGTHTLPMDKGSIDLVCIYCPDTGDCYYVDPRNHPNSVTLRVKESRNRQAKGVLWARDFLDLPASSPGLPPASSHALEGTPWLRHILSSRAA